MTTNTPVKKRERTKYAGLIPFREIQGGEVQLLLGRTFHEGFGKHRHSSWSPFDATTAHEDKTAFVDALRGFHAATGINLKDLEMFDKVFVGLENDEEKKKRYIVEIQSDADATIYFFMNVTEAKDFPLISKIKENLEERSRRTRRAKWEGNKEDKERIGKITKDDFRWINLDVIRRSVPFDNNFFDEDVKVTSEYTGESFSIDKTFLNVLKENNTWGKPFLAFCQKFKV